MVPQNGEVFLGRGDLLGYVMGEGADDFGIESNK